MADNVAITAGSGTTIATDDVSGAHYQKFKLYDGTADSTTAAVVTTSGDLSVQDSGGTPVAGQVTVTNTTTQIVAARATRHELVIVNRQTVAVYIGATSATTAMFKLDPGDSIALRTTARIDGITAAAYSAAGDAKVHYIEVYD